MCVYILPSSRAERNDWIGGKNQRPGKSSTGQLQKVSIKNVINLYDKIQRLVDYILCKRRLDLRPSRPRKRSCVFLRPSYSQGSGLKVFRTANDFRLVDPVPDRQS